MRVAVVGGTGTVGSRVAQALRDRGVAVRVLTRSAEKARALPPGIEGVLADLHRPPTLQRALVGATGVFMAIPPLPTEARDGLAAIGAAAAAGVERFVYLSAAGAEACPHVPLLAAKAAIEQALHAAAGIAGTVIRSHDLFQTDLCHRRKITESGVYPSPIGDVGVSRIDARDVADAAATILTGSGHEGRTYTLGGPDELTGEEIARVFRRHLRRHVRYAGDDLDVWAAQASAVLPAWLIERLRPMYEHFQRHGMLATDGELAAARRLVGHAPRTFEEFADEVASEWRSQQQ